MQAIQLKKKAAVLGTGLFAAALCAAPLGGSASAKAGAAAKASATIGDNAAVNVQTEFNCNTHTLVTDVKNKLDTAISPKVEFDKASPEGAGLPPLGGDDATIEPGQSYKYLFTTSGNNRPIPVSVTVDGYAPVEIDPMAACSEPVSFKVTEFSTKTVVGYLTNNNSQFPQTVTMTAGFIGGERHVYNLQPGESVLVSVPYEGFPQQTAVMVSVSTGPDFESSYMVDLTAPLPVPPLPGTKALKL